MPPVLSIVVACALLAAASPAARATAPEPVRIGVLAPHGAEEADADWAGLARHLQAALPGTRVALDAYDLAGLRDAVLGGRVDFFIANSGFYVDMELRAGAARIATIESAAAPSPGRGIASAVIVRADRPALRGFGDLRGQRLLAVGEEAFGGYQVAWREMQRAGLDPRRDTAELRFAGYPIDRIADEVLAGRADAGIIRACLLEHLERSGRVPPGALRVLAEPPPDDYPCRRSTPLYPDWPVAALRGTPHELAKRVAVALLAIPAGAGLPTWTVPTDYQPVHELFRELRIGPYAAGAPALAEFVARYRGLLGALAAVLLAWAAHTVRVEFLVARRTRELQAALAAREQAEAQAREGEVRVEHLARLGVLGEMASMLAHELAQPLGAIGNFARGLRRRLAAGRADPPAIAEAVEAIEAQAERAEQVMTRIRHFARKDASGFAPVDLDALVEESAALFSAAAARGGPRLVVERGEETPRPLRALGDALQLQQVLLNLLKNAFDAMRDAAPDNATITLCLAAADGEARLSVLDAGPPLTEAQRARLFEPFYTTKPDGVGLGLAICQRTVEAHRGRIEARPAGPRGLELRVTLPLLPHADDD